MAEPLLSIVIPCLNENGVVNRLLDQLLAQQTADIEIITADSGSNDGTVELLESYNERGVIVMQNAGIGVSKARNAGAHAARGEWLLFLDADTTLPKQFIGKLVGILVHEPAFDVATFRYRAATYNPFYFLYIFFSRLYQRLSALFGRQHVTGTGILIRAQMHAAAGGFDESLRFAEDLAYAQTLQGHGARFTVLKLQTYVSVRRLRHFGWLRLLTFYVRFIVARWRGNDFHDGQYDFSEHKLKK